MAGEGGELERLFSDEGPIMKPLSRVDPVDFGFVPEGITLQLGYPDNPAVARDPANPGHPRRAEKRGETWYRMFTDSTGPLAYNAAVPGGITPEFQRLMLAAAAAMRVSTSTLGGETRDALVEAARNAEHPVYYPDNPASGYIQALHYVIEVGRISLAMSEHSYAKVVEALDKIDALSDDLRPSEKDYSQIIRQNPITTVTLNHLTDPNLVWQLRNIDMRTGAAGVTDPQLYVKLLVDRVERGVAVPQLGLAAGLGQVARAQAVEQIWIANSAYNAWGLKAYCGRVEIEGPAGAREFKYYGRNERPATKNPWGKYSFEPQGGGMFLADYIVDVAQKFAGTNIETRLRNLDLTNRPIGWRIMERVTARRRGRAGSIQNSAGIWTPMDDPGMVFSQEFIELTDDFDNNPASPTYNLESNQNPDPNYRKDVDGVGCFKAMKKAALIGKGIGTSIDEAGKGLMEAVGAMVALYKATNNPEVTRKLREENMPTVFTVLADIWEATKQAPKIEDLKVLFDLLGGEEYKLKISDTIKGYCGGRAGRALHKRSLIVEPDPKGGTLKDVISRTLTAIMKSAGG